MTPLAQKRNDPSLSQLICDNFAGGGGASLGLKWAFGRDPDSAINHDVEAIAMHEANHPATRHYVEDIWHCKPQDVTNGEPTYFVWFSPDCTHHSKAKGDKPVSSKRRALGFVVPLWAKETQFRVGIVENVEEFMDWGPIDRKTGKPRIDMKGFTWRRWVRRMEQLGYTVSWRMLCAADFGFYTTRKRLYVQFRRDGQPHEWPEPTHGNAKARKANPNLLPWKGAHECIDWSDLGVSIYERESLGMEPLVENTLRRIAAGIQKFIVGKREPLIVSNDGERIVAPFLAHRGNGERKGDGKGGPGKDQAPRVYDATKPLGTVMAQGSKHMLVAAFLSKHFGGNLTPGSSLWDPASAITCKDHHALTCAFLVKYFGTSTAQAVNDPIGALTTRDRYALCDATVEIDGETYRIVDIRTRMLKPRELARCQGFPDDYVLDPVIGYVGKGRKRREKRLKPTAQVRMIGNSVVPGMAKLIAQAAHRVTMRHLESIAA